MSKKLFNLMGSKHLEPPPLVYLHEHFKKQNLASLKNNWVWFSKEDLQKIIEGIDQIQKDESTKKGDGVRIYYGVYNDKVCEYLDELTKNDKDRRKGGYQDLEGRNTVFFVPTYLGKDESEHVDCITQGSVAKSRDDYQHNRKIPVPHPITGGYDVGTICPPPTPPNTRCSGSNL